MRNRLFHIVLIAVFCILAAIAISTPHIIGLLERGNRYTPFQIHESLQYTRDETYAYAAEVNQYLSGRLRGDAFTWEHRNDPNLFVGEIASVMPLVLLSLLLGSTAQAFVLADFIFPAILFFVIFTVLKKSGYSYHFSVAVPVILIVAPHISSLLPFISKDGSSIFGPTNDALFFSRTPHPQISSIYLFATLGICSFVGTTKKNTNLFLILIVLLTLYSSIFISSTVALGIVILIVLGARHGLLKGKITTLTFLFIGSLPLVINFINLQGDMSVDLSNRYTYSQDFLFPVQLRYLLIALVTYYTCKRSALSKTLLIFIASALFVSDFHQMVLQRSLDADHWISRVAAPLATFALMLLIGQLIKSKTVWIVLAIAFLSLGLCRQNIWFDKNRAALEGSDNNQLLTALILSNTVKSDVIGTYSYDINQFIPGLSGRMIFFPPPDRVLNEHKEQLERLCQLEAISAKYELPQNTDELYLSEAHFQEWKNSTIVANKLNCPIGAKRNFKLDYVITKVDGTYALIKVN